MHVSRSKRAKISSYSNFTNSITFLNAQRCWYCPAYQTFTKFVSPAGGSILINVVDTFYILRTGLINATAGIFLSCAGSGDRSRQSFTVVSELRRPLGTQLCAGSRRPTDRTPPERETKVSSDLVPRATGERTNEPSARRIQIKP